MNHYLEASPPFQTDFMAPKRITYKRIDSKSQIFAFGFSADDCHPIEFKLQYNLVADSDS